MIVPAVTLKVLCGAVAVGAVASSIAVPTVMSMSASTAIVLNGFPSDQKSNFQNKCQLLIKEKDKERKEDTGYLLVCDKDSSSGAEFYYYSSGEEPKKFTRLERNNTLGSNQTKVKVKTEVTEGIGRGGIDFISTNGNWTNLIDKSLEVCGITKNDDEKRWSLKCPKEGTGEGKEIPLTPIVIY